MSLGTRLLRQCSHPSGWLGRVTLWRMNLSHSRVTEWGLHYVSIRPSDTVLDIGCGGGRTVARLATIASEGKVFGIDLSEESVAAARKTNRRLVENGRVDIRPASVSHLPFDDDTFDVVTAVETHYYWPDLVSDLREIRRVLKPGGTFVIIAEAYRGGKYDRLLQRLDVLARRGVMKYAHLTVAEHRELFVDAGYAGIEVVENYDKGWLCARGRKP
jgi:SAM-dependent methyltransferase